MDIEELFEKLNVTNNVLQLAGLPPLRVEVSLTSLHATKEYRNVKKLIKDIRHKYDLKNANIRLIFTNGHFEYLDLKLFII